MIVSKVAPKQRVFLDTEFYEDVENGVIDLISIAMVTGDNRQFYMINSDAKLHRVSPWVREHVLSKLPPYFDPKWRSLGMIKSLLYEFLPNTGEKYEFWAYYASFDWVCLSQIFGRMLNLPDHFPKHCMDLKQLSIHCGSPTHPPKTSASHNALQDAWWNKQLFELLSGLV